MSMNTIWTAKGEPINVRNPKEAPVQVMIQYQVYEKQGRDLEAALFLVNAMVEFKDDMEIVNNMSVDDLAKFLVDWMKAYEDQD